MWNSIINLVGQLIPMVVAIFAIRILVRELHEDRFGVLTLVWAIIGYFSLFDFGLGRTLTHVVASKIGSGETDDLPSQINTSLGLMLGLGLIGGITIFFLSPAFVYLLKIPIYIQRETLISFYLLALAIPLVVLTTGLRGILEAHQQFVALNWIRTGIGIFIFLSPLAVIYFSTSLVSIVSILVAGRFIALLVHFKICLSRTPYFKPLSIYLHGFSYQAMIPLLRAGGWMTVSNIISPLMVYLDRFLIGSYVSVAAVAYYANPYEVVTKLWMIPSAISGVLFPTFAANFVLEKKRILELYGQGIKCVSLLMFPASIFTIVFAFEGLNLWLGKEYAAQSTFVAQWITVGVFVNCVAQVAFTLMQAAGHPDLTAKIHLIELPIYLISICLGLKYFGIKGAAIAWVVRVTIDTLLLVFYTRRILLGFDQEIIKTLRLMVFSTIVLIVGIYVTNFHLKLLFFISSVLVVNVIAWVSVVSAKEKRFLFNYLRSLPLQWLAKFLIW